MKSFILFFFISVLICFKIVSQSYYPMSESSNYWLYGATLRSSKPADDVYRSYALYYFGKDSIENGRLFKNILIKEFDKDMTYSGGYYPQYWLHEDTIKKQVFISSKDGLTKSFNYCNYDFNYTTGDTVKTFIPYQRIDSIKVLSTEVGQLKSYYTRCAQPQYCSGSAYISPISFL